MRFYIELKCLLDAIDNNSFHPCNSSIHLAIIDEIFFILEFHPRISFLRRRIDKQKCYNIFVHCSLSRTAKRRPGANVIFRYSLYVCMSICLSVCLTVSLSASLYDNWFSYRRKSYTHLALLRTSALSYNRSFSVSWNIYCWQFSIQYRPLCIDYVWFECTGPRGEWYCTWQRMWNILLAYLAV